MDCALACIARVRTIERRTFKLISFLSGKEVGFEVVSVHSGGIQFVPVPVGKFGSLRLVIERLLVMAQLPEFFIINFKLDVFHGK